MWDGVKTLLEPSEEDYICKDIDNNDCIQIQKIIFAITK